MIIDQSNLKDTIVVKTAFDWDGITFYPSDMGIIEVLMGDDVCIHWENKKSRAFHDCNGFVSKGNCWVIPGKLLNKHCSTKNITHSSTGNPLPTDPRLRGIALKIIELEQRFKTRKEAKANFELDYHTVRG